MLSNLRFAARLLCKSPWFTATAAATLALGIGSASVIFSAVNGLLLRPLPLIRDQERMLHVTQAMPSKGVDDTDVSYMDFRDWRERSKTLDAIWVYENRTIILTGSDEPERILGTGITAGAFQAMGVQPIRGRLILDEEDDRKAAPVALISYSLWQRRFAGKDDVINQVVTINGEPTTIIGVMPKGWRYPEFSDVWVPMRAGQDKMHRSAFGYDAHAMLKPGVTLDEARAEFATISAALAKEHPATNEGLVAVLRPVREEATENSEQLTVLLFGAVLFVFLIACANVANLLLARASTRTKEIAIRLALGASRRQLLAQLLTESLLLSLLGGIGGLIVGLWGAEAMRAAIPVELPFWLSFDFDPRVFAFVFLLSCAASLIFGLFPAIQTSRPELMDDIKEGGRSSAANSGGNRLRNILIVAEVALALMLLIGAGLMMRSFVEFGRVNPGFDASNTLTFRVGIPSAMAQDREASRLFFGQLTKRLAAQPGAVSASAISSLPGDNRAGSSGVLVEGQAAPENTSELPRALPRVVTPELFATLKIPLLEGRLFTEMDDASHPAVAIVDASFAQTFFPEGNAIGRRFRGDEKYEGKARWLEIVGVTGNVRRYVEHQDSTPTFYVPHAQNPANFMSVAIRLRTPPTAADITAAQSAVYSLNRDLPIYDAMPFEQLIGRTESVWKRRLSGLLFTVFGAVAVLLASVGIYSVMAYSVAQRTPEIGVRMALGAQPRDVTGMIVRQGISLVVAGLVIGFIAAVLTAHTLARWLYGVSPHDPPTFALVPVFLAIIAIAACYLPSLRATRIDPMTALRAE